MVSTLQQRLGRVNDKLRRKIIDNNIRIISDAVDTIICKTRQTYEGDTTSLIIEKADVINCVFPPMIDVPYRKIHIDKETQQWQLTSLVSLMEKEDQPKFFTIQAPYKYNVDMGDFLFRIFIDDDQKMPIIIALQVSDLIGTFGEGQLIMQKFNAVIPTDIIPQEIVDVIKDMAIRRLRINY